VHARILLEAQRQLRYTSAPVSEIAYALGFEDPAYFTRFFSQRTGQAPRAFRLAAARPTQRVQQAPRIDRAS
jgi:AraC family transcriptional regulator, transcriptional activator of pobA